MSDQVTGFRLSPQQRRLWLLQEGSPAFRAQAAVAVTGDLDSERLQRALDRVAARHDSLRTSFRAAPGVKVPLQAVSQEAGVAWQPIAAGPPAAGVDRESWLAGLFEAEAASAPAAGAPVLTAGLTRLPEGGHLLLLGIPALCADRASLANLVADLAAAYGGDGLEDEVAQYVQFSEWQHELLAEEESDGQAFWRAQKLPSGGGGSPVAGAASPFQPRVVAAELDPAGSAALRERAAGLGLGPLDLLLGAWQAVLWRLSDGPSLVTHVIGDGRSFDELQGAVGLFAKALPMRSELDGRRAAGAVLQQVAEAAAEAREWQDSFAWQDAPEPAGLFEGVRRPVPRAAGGAVFTLLADRCHIERFAFGLVAVERSAGYRLEVWYDAARHGEAEARRLAERLQTLLGGVSADPETPVAGLPILGPEELRLLLVDLNRTAAEVPSRPVHELFSEQAGRTPAAPAVIAGSADGADLTYDDLEARANQLAHHLMARGAGPDERVALLLERSAEMVVALLAVLKAGAAYVPLDPAYPRERLALLLADAAPRAVLTRREMAELLPADPAGPELVLIDAERAAIAGRSRQAPAVPSSPASLAYVLYTSGSTGRPKGVMVPHGGLSNYLAWCARAYPVAEGAGVPVHSPLGFDLTVTSLFAPLLAGRCVALLPEAQGVEALAAALAERGDWSFVKLTPGHLDLLRSQLGGLSGRAAALIVGGEALLGESLAPWQELAPGTRLINEYGPTETVVGCVVHEVLAGAAISGPVPIGHPIVNTRIYLLDSARQPVPFGRRGEIHVGGAGVARGYLGNPAATAERFLPDPFGGEPGARLYATGDLGRRRADGALEFLGRNDHQVKIRGFRVEPGEIEAALLRHPGVRECAVLAREDGPGDRRLVAYVVAGAAPAPSVDELRRFLAERLPEHMVPAAFLALDALPLTANGKLNRAALPAPGPERPELEQAYVAPCTPLEETLAVIWSEVLEIDRVGIHDSFFALGGDSIRSVRAVALARERGIESTVQQLFKHQTIAALAGALAAETATAAEQAAGASEEDELLRLLEQVEALSEAEIQERLRGNLQPLT